MSMPDARTINHDSKPYPSFPTVDGRLKTGLSGVESRSLPALVLEKDEYRSTRPQPGTISSIHAPAWTRISFGRHLLAFRHLKSRCSRRLPSSSRPADVGWTRASGGTRD